MPLSMQLNVDEWIFQREPINSIAFTAIIIIIAWMMDTRARRVKPKKGKSSFDESENARLRMVLQHAVRKVDLYIVKWIFFGLITHISHSEWSGRETRNCLAFVENQFQSQSTECIRIQANICIRMLANMKRSALSDWIEFCVVMREHFGVNDNMLKLYQSSLLCFERARKNSKFNFKNQSQPGTECVEEFSDF